MYLLDKPLTIAGQERSEIGVKHYSCDPTLAPPGKSVVEVMLRSDYRYWQRIYGRKLYDVEQLDEAKVALNFIEGLYPGISEGCVSSWGQVSLLGELEPLSLFAYKKRSFSQKLRFSPPVAAASLPPVVRHVR